MRAIAGFAVEHTAVGRRLIDALDRVLEDAAVPPLGTMQLLGHSLLLAPHPRLLERDVHRLPEPREPILDQIVGRPAPHRLDGRLLADGARDDDEGHLGAMRVQQLEGAQTIELRQVEIGEDDIERASERIQEGGFRVDPTPLGREAGSLQLAQQQLRVERIVFDEQDAQRHWVFAAGTGYTSSPGAWFMSNQYMPSCCTASVNRSKLTGLTM